MKERRATTGIRLSHSIIKARQAAPLSAKVALSMQLMSEHRDGVCLFSGGKDSTVLAHFASLLGITSLRIETTMETADILEHFKSCNVPHEVARYEGEPPFQYWQRTGYWPLCPKISQTKVNRATGLKLSPVSCCEHFKERPMKDWMKARGLKPKYFWGLKASDGFRRLCYFANSGQVFNRKNGQVNIYPIAYWTDADVIEYIRAEGLTMPPTGREMGCVYCGTGMTFADNNIKTLFKRDRARWADFMRAGAGAAILTMNGQDPEQLEQHIEAGSDFLNRVWRKYE